MLSIKEYLDMEIGNVGTDAQASELIRAELGDVVADEFIRLFGNVYSEWGHTYSQVEQIETVEGESYDFIYGDPRVERLCLAGHRSIEEISLDYITPLINSRGSVLDVGIGGGIKSVYYALTSGASITGVDRLESALALASQRAARHGVSLNLINANIRQFDLGRQFDAVLATCVIHESGDCRDCGGPYGPKLWVREKVQNLTNHVAPGGLFLATFQEIIGKYISMSRDVGSYVEGMGLVDIKIDELYSKEDLVLRAVSGVKPS